MPNRIGVRRGIVVAAAALAALALACPPAFAASVHVSPTTGVKPAGQTLTVTGSGFDPVRNNGFGVYVVFGPRAADWTTNANAYLAAKWVHTGAAASAGQAPMSASGTFSVGLSVRARYTDGDGKKVDCLKTRCYVITMAAHGVPDRSQDTFTPIAFTGSESRRTSGSAGSKAGQAPSGTSTPSGRPAASASPSAVTSLSSGAPPDDAATAGAFTQLVTGGDSGSPWPFWGTTVAAVAVAVAARYGARRLPARRRRHRTTNPAP